jgi:hypothetical protein
MEVCERFSQLLEFLRRAVHFHPGQVGHLERCREERANVFQMSENAIGIGIALAAENFVAIDGEPIEKILLFARRFLNEGWERGFESLEFS